MVAFTKSSLIAAALCLGVVANSQAETLLLDFMSASCGPCQEMRPTIERLKSAGYRVRQVDIAREPALAAQFHVDQVPTFISLVDGREYARMVGKGSYEELIQIMTPRTVRGQSPDPLRSPPVAQFASVNDNSVAASTYAGLDTPQAGRIIELEDPHRIPARSDAPVANPFGASPPAQPAVNANHAKLIESTVKIAVEDAEGTSNGTGTIVDAREGAALVLTCGHIFRESAGKGAITITFFQSTPTGAQSRGSASGQVLNYDLERDVALVVVKPQGLVKAVPIAPANTPLNPGAGVTTVGCNGGANPTAIDSQITTIDRYQGPPNVEVAGAPIEGRSGGGLFNAAGQLIGVCFAADPQSNEGLYASLPSIQAKLDSLNLAMVYQNPSAQIAVASAPIAPVAVTPTSSAPPTSVAIRGQDELVERLPDAFASGVPPIAQKSLNSSEQAALEEIQRRGLKSEVICIIRPHDPEGKSEVITLNNVSADFVGRLADPGVAANRSPATAAAGQMLR
jgi:thiol-disulfide isomerase/thioredoxin